MEGKGRKGRGGRGGSIGAGLSDPPFKNSLTNIKMIKSKTPQPLPSDVDLGSCSGSCYVSSEHCRSFFSDDATLFPSIGS